MTTKQLNSDQVKARLIEIDQEQAALEAVNHEALIAAALIKGKGVEEVESAADDSIRLLRRLRIERESHEKLLPEILKAEAQPLIEKLKSDNAAKVQQAADAVADALSHWAAFNASLEQLQDLRKVTGTMTREAIALAELVGADSPGAVMGVPTSKALSTVGERMRYLGRDLLNWAVLPHRVGSSSSFIHYGQNVDKPQETA